MIPFSCTLTIYFLFLMKFLDENVQAWEFTTLYLIARKFHSVFCAFDTSIVILSKCILLNTLTLVKKKVKKSKQKKTLVISNKLQCIQIFIFSKNFKIQKKNTLKNWYGILMYNLNTCKLVNSFTCKYCII